MPELLHHIPPAPAPAVAPDEQAARRSLREQVAGLERQLADQVAATFPRIAVEPLSGRFAGPRILGLAELEALRDQLAERLGFARGEAAAIAERQAAKRRLIEAMLLAPHEHKWRVVHREEIGEPGCGTWHVRPRLGLIGMLAGWWHVKISSGCPRPAAA